MADCTFISQRLLRLDQSRHYSSFLCQHHEDIDHHLQRLLFHVLADRSRSRIRSIQCSPQHDGQQESEEESFQEAFLLLSDRWQPQSLCCALPFAAPGPVSHALLPGNSFSCNTISSFADSSKLGIIRITITSQNPQETAGTINTFVFPPIPVFHDILWMTFVTFYLSCHL